MKIYGLLRTVMHSHGQFFRKGFSCCPWQKNRCFCCCIKKMTWRRKQTSYVLSTICLNWELFLPHIVVLSLGFCFGSLFPSFLPPITAPKYSREVSSNGRLESCAFFLFFCSTTVLVQPVLMTVGNRRKWKLDITVQSTGLFCPLTASKGGGKGKKNFLDKQVAPSNLPYCTRAEEKEIVIWEKVLPEGGRRCSSSVAPLFFFLSWKDPSLKGHNHSR